MFFPDVTLALFHTCRILLSRHLHKQLSGEVSSALHGCARVAIHPFIPFYDARLAHLCELMRTAADASLPRGVLHGDPFLDNVLVDPHTGALCGWIDFEDATVGPLLFDVACCVSACCFEADHSLNLARVEALLAPHSSHMSHPIFPICHAPFFRVEALLEGYAAVRPMQPAERHHFVGWMQVCFLSLAHCPHMSHPIPPICHTPFSLYVTPHSSHMSHPIFPICHTPFSPYVTPHFFCRRRSSAIARGASVTFTWSIRRCSRRWPRRTSSFRNASSPSTIPN